MVHTETSIDCPSDFPQKISAELAKRNFYRKPREAQEFLKKILLREIEVARSTVHAYNAGEMVPLDQQLPYVDRAANILSSSSKTLSLKVNTSTQSGTDKQMEAEVQMSSNLRQSAELGRLALYLLQTRARLDKVKNDSDCKRFNIGDYMYLCERHEMRREKEEFLLNNKELHTAKAVKSFCCSKDTEWCARILQILAPRLEWITVDNVGPEHMHILSSMPRLRRLRLWLATDDFGWDDFGPFQWDDDNRFNVKDNDPKDPTRPFWFEELPVESSAGLLCLKADMPRQVILPLIIQHRRTLRELSLDVSEPSQLENEIIDLQRRWVWSCHDLPQRLAELLDRFSLPALRLVILWRLSSHSDEGHVLCGKQLRAVRRVFGPSVAVICNRCG